MSKWIQGLEHIPVLVWTEKEKEVMYLATSTVSELELPPDKAQCPLSAQVAYACSMILRNVNIWGLSTILLDALTEYADQIML